MEQRTKTMSDLKKQLKIKFDSDWHIGTGTEIPGNIDRLVIRDSDGLPFVPAKTINGIWRDALEVLTAGFGGKWNEWVDFIFGNQPALQNADPTIKPQNSKINLQPAGFSQNLRNLFSNDERLKQALTFVKPGIAIDDKSGTAKQDHLRFEEMSRSGAILEAEFEINTDDETAETVEALLVLSAELVERLGGKRRRGAGKCKFLLEGLMSKEDALNYIENNKEAIENTKHTSNNKKEITFEDIQTSDTDEWQKIEYRVVLQTPVSIVTAVLGNVSESLDFIPGTYFLSHITKALGGDISTHIAAGNFQVSPATIEIDGERGLPIPKVFACQKVANENGRPIYNRLKQTPNVKDQTKPLRSEFVKSLEKTNKLVIFEENIKTLLIHNTVQDDKQRPTSEVGGVFSREAIKAETVLRGEIRWQKSLNLTKDDFGKPEKLRLGTSKKDDYGLVKFETTGVIQNVNSNTEPSDDKKLYVYLESDVIIRNDNLQNTNLVKDFAKLLKQKLEVKSVTLSKSDKYMTSLIQVRRIESWNVK